MRTIKLLLQLVAGLFLIFIAVLLFILVLLGVPQNWDLGGFLPTHTMRVIGVLFLIAITLYGGANTIDKFEQTKNNK